MKIIEAMLPMEDGVKLYTCVLLPEEEEAFSVAFFRTPYDPVPTPEHVKNLQAFLSPYVDNRFAVVWQHCRGRGGSEGEFVPFRDERADGLRTLAWIAKQDWCDGSVYPVGGSYLSYVHLSYLAVAPACVKGAALSIMCVDGSLAFFKNGAYKSDLGPMWYMNMYHTEQLRHGSPQDTYAREYFQYPIAEFSRRAYGRDVEPMNTILNLLSDPAACPLDYSQARFAARACPVPVLFKDGWSEMFLTGMIRMWRELPPDIREKSAFIMGPWGHGCCTEPTFGYPMVDGDLPDNSDLEWLLHLRDGKELSMCQEGMVRYYAIGENVWKTAPDFPDLPAEHRLYLTPDRTLAAESAAGELSYAYDPADPPSFPGGPDSFCTPPAAFAAQPKPNFRPDVISFLSEPMTESVTLQGCVKAALSAASDCDDTAFVLRLSCVREGTATVMQTALVTLAPYVPGEWKEVSVCFDPVCWTLHPGEQLRLDVSSADAQNYFVHPNYAGDWKTISSCRKAVNRIRFPFSWLELPAKRP